MFGFLKRKPTVHDFTDNRAVFERLSHTHGEAVFLKRPVYKRDILRMWDGDWLVEQVEPQQPLYLCRISRLRDRVAA